MHPLAAWRERKVAKKLLATRESARGTIYGAEIEEREPGTARCRIGDEWYVNFGLADVFGFSCDPGVVGPAESALRDWGVFYGASRVYQEPRLYRELEERIAEAVGTEIAIAFNSVTTVHCGFLPSLARQGTCTVFIDRFAHNSLWRACELCAARGATVVPFPHNDADALGKLLSSGESFPIVAVDSVYSMGGDFAPLREIHELVTKHEGLLYCDDAHGTAVYGKRGGGYAAQEFGTVPENVLVVGSLSKALSGNGGFLACGQEWRDFIESAAEGFIFNGPIPPAMLAADIAAIDILLSEEYPDMVTRLHAKQEGVLACVRELGLDVVNPGSHIIAMPLDEEKAVRVASRLFESGILVNTAIFPAVPAKQGIIRLTPSLLHSDEDMSALSTALAEAVNE